MQQAIHYPQSARHVTSQRGMQMKVHFIVKLDTRPLPAKSTPSAPLPWPLTSALGLFIYWLGSEPRGAYGFRKRQPDPGRHTCVLGTRKIVGRLQGNDFMPAKGHQVRRKKQEPWPLRSSHQGCSAQLQRDGVDRSRLHAGTREEQTLLFSKEPAAQMERQDRHLRTLKPPLRQL